MLVTIIFGQEPMKSKKTVSSEVVPPSIVPLLISTPSTVKIDVT